jgi:hypothetical protein
VFVFNPLDDDISDSQLVHFAQQMERSEQQDARTEAFDLGINQLFELNLLMHNIFKRELEKSAISITTKLAQFSDRRKMINP